MMRRLALMGFSGICAVVMWCTFTHSLHAQSATVERIADLIERHYFDEGRGSDVAMSLRAALVGGEFSGLTDPRDLAAGLSARLAGTDGHFRVSWSDPDDAGDSPTGPERMPEPMRAARWNYGFRHVEVLPGNVGLIELSEFADLDGGETLSPARSAADAALALVAHVDALIFDLRDNGGGGGMADFLLSYFLPPGIVYNEMRGRTESRQSRTAADIGGERRPGVPIYVVVSGRTGSAAEFFAYSLQSLGRATIVGERTAGAANPGRVFDAGDGFGVFIPLATPINSVTGTNWEGTGVVPDVQIHASESLRRAHVLALETVLATSPSAPAARDARWALDALLACGCDAERGLSDLTGTYGNRVVRIEAGRLVLVRDRWPVRVLRPVGPDEFTVEGASWRRVAFERDDEGNVVALVESTSDGDVTRWRRMR